MKKGISLAFALTGFIGVASAQPAPPPSLASAPLDAVAVVFLVACGAFAVYTLVSRRRKSSKAKA
ncbi:MAG: hypothetical protein ACPGU4_07515 [Flavobacteriales bacterium]